MGCLFFDRDKYNTPDFRPENNFLLLKPANRGYRIFDQLRLSDWRSPRLSFNTEDDFHSDPASEKVHGKSSKPGFSVKGFKIIHKTLA
jgi:hypothetical protein